jgi:hypothetical protein
VDGVGGLLVCLLLTGAAPPPPPPPPLRDVSLRVKVYPEPPVIERTGGLQQLNFEFRLEAVGGPVKLLNILVKSTDRTGGLSRFRQLVPANYPANFSDVAVFDGEKFVGSQPFAVSGPIPSGGRVLFFNPWHSFGADELLGGFNYTFYFVDDRGRVGTTSVDVKPMEARALVPLRLPITGRWLVLEGHDYETHHRRIFSPINGQRYASDFVALHPGDVLYKGDGTKVTDYASFGADVVSPGSGTVVARENGLVDNPIGARDDVQQAGNHVVIDHGGGLFSVLSHLQKGSVTVNVGDKVGPGQLLGKVGNSGASDLPHLHYHLQKGADLQISRAEGVVALFSRYKRVLGKQEILVETGAPATGDVVLMETVKAPEPVKKP